jgi:hypothetical protein
LPAIGNVETKEEKAQALHNLFDHPIETAVHRSSATTAKKQRARPAAVVARAQARGFAALMKQ